jgi:hypothetical protein
MKVTVRDLHRLDFGAHIETLEEWNDTTSFEWAGEDIELIYDFPYSTVTHRFTTDDNNEGIAVVQYATQKEGDIVSMVVFDRLRMCVLIHRNITN